MRPDSIFGYFQNYKITTQLRAQTCREWESEGCVEHQKIQYLYEADLTEETIYGLKKFRWYRFQVAASTNAGYGNASDWISTQTLAGRKYRPLYAFKKELLKCFFIEVIQSLGKDYSDNFHFRC